jgi:isoleucyl-tRNA synthetase
VEDVTILRRASGALLVQEAAGRFAALDPELTPVLRREGLARELVSRVQRMRKDAGFEVSDRIRLRVDGDAELLEALAEHREWVAGEVLARELTLGATGDEADNAGHAADLDGIAARVALTRD